MLDLGSDYKDKVGSIKVWLTSMAMENDLEEDDFIGARFKDIHLYLSEPIEEQDSLMLAGKSAASSDNEMGFTTGFLVGLGSGSFVMSMAACALYKRKSVAI